MASFQGREDVVSDPVAVDAVTKKATCTPQAFPNLGYRYVNHEIYQASLIQPRSIQVIFESWSYTSQTTRRSLVDVRFYPKTVKTG